jgi:phage terminase large subunit
MIVSGKNEIDFARPFMPLIAPKSPYRIICYHGGRGGGKSYHYALALLAKGRRGKYRFLCTREIQNTIRDSVHKLLSDLIGYYDMFDYKVTEKSITNKITGTEFIFKGLHLNDVEIKSTEGIDICWVEEAFSVRTESWEFLQPTIRKENSQIWCSFNRMMDNDPVWIRYCQNPDNRTLVRKVNYYDNPFLPETLRLDMEADKEKDYESYLHVWEGEPRGQSAESILSRAKVARAMDYKTDCIEGAEIVGADIARFGDDKIVFVKRKGLKAIGWKVKQHQKIPKTAYDLMDYAGNKSTQCNVDATGLGSGVVDILDEHKQSVVGVDNGSKPKEENESKYKNAIAEMWFEFKNILDEGNLDLSELNDEELKDELTMRQYYYNNKGQIVIEDKKTFKKRIGRSPDKADAVLLSFYDVHPINMEVILI